MPPAAFKSIDFRGWNRDMALPVVRCLLLFLVVFDCGDDWLLAAVRPTQPANVREGDESFVLLAVRYRMEIQKQIDEPLQASVPVPVIAPALLEIDSLCEQQTRVLPPLPGADPLYAFMSLQQ